MTASHISMEPDAPAHNRRASQLRYLCHFLEVFASGNPVSRAAASQYGERLRGEGCDSDEVIRMAATSLLMAIEHEIDEKTLKLEWSSTYGNGSSLILEKSREAGEGHQHRAA